LRKNFKNDSQEFMLFCEFWEMCKEYWIPEKNDDYWDSVVQAVKDFAHKYQGGENEVFTRQIALAYLTSLEEKWKRRETGNGQG